MAGKRAGMIYISLGSNFGNRLDYLRKAVRLLKDLYFTDLKCSIILETKALQPIGAPADWGKPFLNMIVWGHSTLSPIELLKGLKEIEHKLGRPTNYKKWAPRTIDLDILLWDDVLLNTADIMIPHPELLNRFFLVHLMALINPFYRHPITHKTFGEIANNIPNINECFQNSFVLFPQLVGIVNITLDSFSDGGLYIKPDHAIQRSMELATQGASMIELGAQSTRPNNTNILTSEMEYNRLATVLEGLHDLMNMNSISIDSYCDEVILKTLDNYPVTWINDVKGDLKNSTLQKIAQQGCKFVAMHSLSIPQRKEINLPHNYSPVFYLTEWAKKKIRHLLQCGFQEDEIVLDPGIGFGKSAYQNILLLQHIDQIKTLGYPLLIGHSRKIYNASFSKEPSSSRDIETIAASNHLFSKHIDFLRVHNVRDHQRFFVTQQVLQGGVDVP